MNTKQSTKILIVEDEFVTSKHIGQTLSNLGYDVVGVATYGEQAIDKAAHLQPDLVLMDIQLKGPVDGVTVAQQIQTHYGIPVVYLTAHSDEITIQRVLHSNPYGYIVKPFQVDDLRDTIENALNRHLKRRKAGDNLG